MSALVVATQVGQRAEELRAAKAAEKDFPWWATQIARAAAGGKWRCDNLHRLPWNRWSSSEYVHALQGLMPERVTVTREINMRGPDYVQVLWYTR